MSSIRIKKVWKDLLDKHEPAFLGDVVGTTDLQLESLYAFMYILGYTPNTPDEVTTIKDFFGEYGFIYRPHILRSIQPKFISLEMAVSLHNGSCIMRKQGDYEWKTNSIPSITLWDKPLKQAYKTRLVETVYVQYSKKKKSWKVMKHRVQFTPDKGY